MTTWILCAISGRSKSKHFPKCCNVKGLLFNWSCIDLIKIQMVSSAKIENSIIIYFFLKVWLTHFYILSTTFWLPEFFKISFMFCRRKSCIFETWHNFQFWVNFPIKDSGTHRINCDSSTKTGIEKECKKKRGQC